MSEIEEVKGLKELKDAMPGIDKTKDEIERLFDIPIGTLTEFEANSFNFMVLSLHLRGLNGGTAWGLIRAVFTAGIMTQERLWQKNKK